MRELLVQKRRLNAQELQSAIIDAVMDFAVGEFADDAAIMVVEVK